MNRKAATQLIQQYFQQLTVGCGDADCSNTYCASSAQFKYGEPLQSNEAAAETLKLTKLKAPLCQHVRASVKRLSEEEGPNSRSSASSDSKSTEDQTDSGIASTHHQATKKGNISKELGATNNVSINHSAGAMVYTATAMGARYPSTSDSKSHEVIDDLKCGLMKERLVDVCTSCQTAGSWSKLIRLIGATFRDCDLLVSNFLVPLQKEFVHSMEVDADKDVDVSDMSIDDVSEMQSTSSGAVVFLPEVDIARVHQSFAYLFDLDKHFDLPELPFTSALATAVEALTIDMVTKSASDLAVYANVIFILMELPLATVSELGDRVVPCLCRMVERLPVNMQARLVTLWSKCDASRLRDMVHLLQQYVSMQVIANSWSRDVLVNNDVKITSAVKLLKIFYYASIAGGKITAASVRETEKKVALQDSKTPAELLQELMQRIDGASGTDREDGKKMEEDPLERELGFTRLDCREPLLPLDNFVNEPLSDVIEMDKDYVYYRSEASDKFSFMLHQFVLTTLTKNMAMYFDNRVRMLQERRQSFIQTFIGGQISLPHLRLHIRRDHIIDDALVALELAAQENPDDLKKQLYVEFEGEQGIDEGGLSKEFFQLVVEELFNPDYGMFIWSEEAQAFWFNAMSFENDSQFSLVGILLGLAIYNSIILDVRFPIVVYRKLLGKLGTFDDLRLSHPALALGLKQMLEYEGEEFEDVFEQTFAISYQDVFGNSLSHDLKPDGADIPVTKHNRQEFVDLYADFLLNKSVASQFQAFRRGFCLVTDESPLRLLFMPEEVEQLVCGSRQYDFHAMEAGTTYDGGFSEDSTTVRHFWDVVHNDFNDEQRRKLLEFVTGSDRAPLGGLGKLRLVIARNGPDSDRLPTTHTCFNVLLLPDYDSRDKLRDLLLKAVNYAKGFGLL